MAVSEFHRYFLVAVFILLPERKEHTANELAPTGASASGTLTRY